MPRNIDRTDRSRINRRQWLSMLGVGGTVALAGCGGSSNDDGGSGDDGGDDGGMDDGGDDGSSGDDGSDDGGDDGIDQEEEVDKFPDRADSYDTNQASEFTTLNPLYNTEAGAGTAIGRALDLGYTFDADNNLFPLLYDMETDNGDVWVFSVRENLQFSDPYGQVTAEDFVYMIQELHQSEWAATANSGDWGSEINVTMNSEFEFQAELPSADLLWPETFTPLEYGVPKDLVEPFVAEEDADGLRQNEELLELQFTGNLGAYVLDEWERGAGTTYSRNENYYLQGVEDGPDLFQEAPYFNNASISVVPEQSSRLAQLETGEVDAAAIPPAQYQSYVDNQDVSVKKIPQPYNEKVSVNMRDNGWNAGPGNLFRYKEFRQAMASAIDKQQIIDGVLRGLGAPHFTWQPSWSPFYPNEDSITKYGVGDNLGAEQAKSLAEEAFSRSEYDYGFDGDTMVTPEGDQVTLEFLHINGDETDQLIAETVAEGFNERLGMNVQTQAIQGTQFNDEYWVGTPAEAGITDEVNGKEVTWEAPNPNNPGPRSVTSNEPWDMSMVYGLNTFPRNPMTNSLFFDGANAFYNPVGWYPETEIAPLFTEAREAAGRDELVSAFQSIFELLSEEQPYVMMIFNDDTTGYNPDLAGPIEDFSNGWDFPTWHIEE